MSFTHVGNHFEWRSTIGNMTRYYYLGSQRVAMRQGGVLTYLHGDHLGSASLATDVSGAKVSEQRYLPYGGTRSGSMPTDRQFTGQRWESSLGFYDYVARQFDPALGRFLQADTIVPDPGNPQSLNRYSYTLGNPLRYTDPSGHFTEEAIQGYLERKYGDRWSYYWQILEDIGFLSLLRAAQAGDILVHITLDRGKRGLATGYYAFEGSSDTLLFALRTADEFHHNPTLGAEAGLLDALPGLGQGLALFRFSADGQITAQAGYGKGAFASAGVIPPQQDYFWSAVRWGAKLLIKKICPLPVCDAANAADSIFNPTKNLWPRAGDVEVSYGIWHNESRSDKVIRGTYGINYYRFRDGLCVDFNTLYLDNVYGHRPW